MARMQKIGRIGMCILLTIMFLIQQPLLAQNKKYFVITGRIVPEAEGTGTGSIEISKNGKETSTIDIPKNGRFRFELEFFNEYSLTFKYPGHFNKIINVSTQIPQEVWQRDSDFPPFPMVVQLAKEFEGIDKSFTLKPSGRIFYGKDIDNFEKESYISDIQIINEINAAKNKASQVQKEANSISKENAADQAVKQKNFDQLIKDADALYQRGEYQMALMKYMDARSLFPEKAYPNDRVSELQDLVKALQMTDKQKAELEQKYKDAIAKANGLFDQKSYTEARPVYEEALQYKPGDVYANGRITEIDQLLALLEKQKQYKDLIAQADKNYQAKNYDQAVTLYTQAKQAVPDETYPQKQLDLINQAKQQQAKADQLDKDFNQAIQTAGLEVQQKDYPQALDSYKKALGLKPDSKLAKDKIAEMEQAIVAVETDKKYQQAIQLADQALAANDLNKAKMQYQEALKMKPGEPYPQNKLAEIATSEANEIKFNDLVTNAEKAFSDNKPDESLALFTQALALKPNNPAVLKRIDDIQNLKKQIAADKTYSDLVAQADQAYGNDLMDDALSAYNKALQMKKSETYPKDQIKKIGDYQSIVKKADKLFGSKDFQASLGSFNDALGVKTADKYATSKIAEIQKIMDDQKKQDDQAKAQLQAYNDAIKAADQLLADKSYPESLGKYKEAATINDTENYPKKKIKEIENILDGLAKEKAKNETEYQSLIAQADKLLDKKDYSNARPAYQKALEIKPEDAYPQGQIKKIDDLLAEIHRQEEAQQQLQAQKQDQAFNQALASGDKAFAAKDFETAKTSYQAALTIKPDDKTAKEKLGQAEAQIAQLTRMTLAYNKAIDQANKQLTDKKYQEAKDKYQEALQYLPDSEYPKTQIAKIDAVLAQQQAEAQTRKNFDQAVADGESLMKTNNLAKAKDAFMKAYNLIPSESLPPKRMKEIDDLLDAQARKEAALKSTLEAFKDAIGRADKFFGNKEYTSAKLVYNEALVIKPDEKYPADQLALIEKLLKEQNEQLYKTAVVKADEAFNAVRFDDAANSYKEALTYKKDDQYATRRLKEIDQKKSNLEAEQIRQKKIDDQYNAIVADAGNDFRNKDYQKSKDKYQQALILKPAETLPKEEIAKIDAILNDLQKQANINNQYTQLVKDAQDAFKANKLKEARDNYQKAHDLKGDEPLPPIRIAEIDKMLAQLDETAKLAAMEEAQRQAKEKADRLQYDNAVAAGDKAFAEKQYPIARAQYTTALTALPNEKYPKDQIAKIDDLIAQEQMDKMVASKKAQQDSMQKAKEKLFNLAMASAKDFEQNKQYDQAIQKYQDAIQIMPDQRQAILKLISDDNDKIQMLAKQVAEYQRIIKQADDLFSQTKLNEALAEYRNATTVKPDEDYPKKQISLIQSQLTALEQKYNQAIAGADKAYDASDWANAKKGYTEALSYKPDEKYPLDRLKDVNQKIADAEMAAIENNAENKAYREAIEKAEKALKDNQLVTAKMQFQTAQNLKPSEKLPPEKIKEIDALIDQRNKDLLNQTQREIDEKYRQAISVADNSFREKSYSIAKLQYKQAQLIKPDESYPKNQMDLIDKLMNEAKPAETYSFKLPDLNKPKQPAKPAAKVPETEASTEARALNYQTTTNYDEAIKKADELYGVKDFSVARFYYYKANEIRPDEKYPKDQIEKIRQLIDSQLSASDISGYDQAIKQADDAFAAKNYSISKFFYYKALDIKSWEKYPKDRINEIAALTNSLLSDQEEKDYRDVIAKADEAYANKDIAIARFYYNKAASIKKDEEYPKIKLNDIKKLIDQDARDQQNQEYLQIIDAGDQAMKSENYSIARFNYNKALTMKPSEKYPKDQLKLIKDALDKKSN